MEENSIHHLSLFLDTPIYVLQEEKKMLLEGQVPFPKPEETLLIDEEVPRDTEIDKTEEVQRLAHEGGFEKGVLVAFDSLQLTGELKELLFKILDAVGCSLKDIALCHDGVMEAASMEEIEAMNPAKVIIFGRITHPLMNHKKENYTVQLAGEREYLFADGLEQIDSNKALKKALWLALKNLFNVTK